MGGVGCGGFFCVCLWDVNTAPVQIQVTYKVEILEMGNPHFSGKGFIKW